MPEVSGVVVVNKPSGPTSFDVVRRVKGLFKVKRVGHTGTLDPTATDYIVNWVFFTVVSLLPLAVAIVLLLVAREWAERLLEGVRRWLDGNARTIAAVIIVALAASLIRNGIAGLTA